MAADLASVNPLTAIESVLSAIIIALIASYTSIFSHTLRLSRSLIQKSNARHFPPKTVLPKPKQQEDLVAPSETVVRQAEERNKANGHGNFGYLSLEAGFSPLQAPITQLPKSHAAWDEIAKELPNLVKAQCIRKSVDELPLLQADSASLNDRYLQRAATILGILAHAYVRLEGDMSLTKKVQSHDEVLPPNLYKPWTQVCTRLGRSDAFLTYIDLVLYNYKTTAVHPTSVNLDNSKLLVPTVDNKEEHTFYGIMIEMNGKLVPIFQNVIQSQRLVLANDTKKLESTLKQIASQLRGMTTTLGKLSANKFRKSGIDPVVWTKTVANLAIPWLAGVTGSAGTAHPFFHMMDEFIERNHYKSKIGAEALRVRSDFPTHWQQFLNAIRKTSVNDYVTAANKPSLTQCWQSVKEAYTGDEGLLGFHRRKVYGFLSVSFRIGRGSTINGLGQRQTQQKWGEANDELEKSRTERATETSRSDTVEASIRETRQYPMTEVILHNNSQNGLWFSAQGKVYDATSFLAGHPGGERVIALIGGQDATKDLAAVAHLTPAMLKVLERYQIGTVQYKRFASYNFENMYSTVQDLAFKVAEIEVTYTAATSFLDKQMTSADSAEELNAHKRRHFQETQTQLCNCHAGTLLLQIQQCVRPLVSVGAIRRESVPTIETKFEQKLKSRCQSNVCVDESLRWHTAAETIQRNCDILACMKVDCCKVVTQLGEFDHTIELMGIDASTSVKSRLKGLVSQITLLTA